MFGAMKPELFFSGYQNASFCGIPATDTIMTNLNTDLFFSTKKNHTQVAVLSGSNEMVVGKGVFWAILMNNQDLRAFSFQKLIY